MTRKEFHKKCRKNGFCNSIAIEQALIELLSCQPNNIIDIPTSRYCSSDSKKVSKEKMAVYLIDYLEGMESIEVSFMDDNNHECYIADMKLVKDKITITAYDYYQGQFIVLALSQIIDAKDAMRFALEFAKFENGPVNPSPAELNDEQLDLLDEFVIAARKLNAAGVSLFWNDDDNALAVANRDAMQDCDFFEQDNEEIASNPESESLFDNLSASLDVEVNFISNEQDYLYFPKKI